MLLRALPLLAVVSVAATWPVFTRPFDAINVRTP